MSDETTAAPASDTPAPAAAPFAPPSATSPAPTAPQAASAPATLRFDAPADTSAIIFSTGRSLGVDNGVLEAPDDLTESERVDLARLGFKAA